MSTIEFDGSEEGLVAIERRIAAVPPLPWQACGAQRGGCQCGNVWSLPIDAPIVSFMGRDNSEIENAGDPVALARFMAHAGPDLLGLIAEVRRLRAMPVDTLGPR